MQLGGVDHHPEEPPLLVAIAGNPPAAYEVDTARVRHPASPSAHNQPRAPIQIHARSYAAIQSSI